MYIATYVTGYVCTTYVYTYVLTYVCTVSCKQLTFGILVTFVVKINNTVDTGNCRMLYIRQSAKKLMWCNIITVVITNYNCHLCCVMYCILHV